MDFNGGADSDIRMVCARGTTPTPKGMVSVEWCLDKKSQQFTMTVTAPQGGPVEWILPDGSKREENGNGTYSVSCNI